MLDAVVRTIDKLQQRIRAHRDEIGQYEHRTRASLIDPLLRALGWDVGDPAQVTLEKPIDALGRPDYALLGEKSGKPVLFIEAKKLAVKEAPIEQLVAYVTGENLRSNYKVSFGAWTNGDVWQVIDVVRQEVVAEARLSQDTAADCAFKLLGLWRDSLIDGSLRTPVELHSKRRIDPSDQESKPPPKRRAKRTGKGRSGTLADFDAATDGTPTSIAFPGETARPLRTQKELLVSVANYLIRTNQLTANNGALRSGHRRYLVHSSPEHPGGNAFKGGVELDNGLHLETSHPFPQTVKYAQKLLDHFGSTGLARRVKIGCD